MSGDSERVLRRNCPPEQSQPVLPFLDNLAREIDPRNPEDITMFWRTVWDEDGRKAGLSIQVPDFPDSARRLSEIEILYGSPIFVPYEICTQETRYLLGLMYPEMAGSRALQKDNRFTNASNRFGWRYVASSRHAPYLGTTEVEMIEILKGLGAESINLTELVIAGKYSKRRTEHYLDERTWVRVPSSGDILGVRSFNPGGCLRIVSELGLAAQNRCERLGFRWSMPMQNPSHISLS